MTNCSTNDHPPLFVQINTTSADNNSMKKSESKTFPVQPSEEYVGEFKVTPDVHMGYAITWLGLSGAGVIMTRKLLTRVDNMLELLKFSSLGCYSYSVSHG